MASTPSQTKLLFRKGFFALFTTQLLSAFNDNFFKNAVVIWISASQAQLFGVSPEVMITICSGVFVLPFFILSASAGQLADRYEKPCLIRFIKLAEIGIMAVGALGFLTANLATLLVAIFMLGVHSTFLGPIKYSILPQLVSPDELVAGNALVEMGTFLAILAGTIGGGVLVLMAHGPLWTAGTAVFWAALGFLASLRIPRLPPVAPDLQVSLSPLGPTLEILRITHKTRAVFLSALGISWFWFFGAALLSLLPTYARETLGAHEHVVTLFLSIFCVGIAVGSLLCEKVSGKNLELGLVPFGSIGMTVFTLDLFLVGSPAQRAVSVLEIDAFLAQPGAVRISIDLFGIALFGGFYTVPLYTLISFLFKQGKTIPIAPEHENKAIMDRAFERIAAELREGEVVCIFPEGKLTRSGEMNVFKTGIERIIKQTPVPVIPMALAGLWGSMFSRKDPGRSLKLPRTFRSQLRLVIGTPVPPERVTAAELEQRVRELLVIASEPLKSEALTTAAH